MSIIFLAKPPARLWHFRQEKGVFTSSDSDHISIVGVNIKMTVFLLVKRDFLYKGYYAVRFTGKRQTSPVSLPFAMVR